MQGRQRRRASALRPTAVGEEPEGKGSSFPHLRKSSRQVLPPPLNCQKRRGKPPPKIEEREPQKESLRGPPNFRFPPGDVGSGASVLLLELVGLAELPHALRLDETRRRVGSCSGILLLSYHNKEAILFTIDPYTMVTSIKSPIKNPEKGEGGRRERERERERARRANSMGGRTVLLLNEVQCRHPPQTPPSISCLQVSANSQSPGQLKACGRSLS